MPLPLDSDCVIPTEVCCDDWFVVGEAVAFAVRDAVSECVMASDCPFDPVEFPGFVTMGFETEDVVGDAVSVRITNVTASAGSRDRNGVLMPIVQAEVSYEVQLMETGWPTIGTDPEGNVVTFPNREDVHAVARHAVAHGELMYRATVSAVLNRTGLPSGCSNVNVGAMVPVAPSGGQVGWRIPFSATFKLNG